MAQLYIIQSGKGNKYKVGIAKDPESRLKTLQTGSAERLTLRMSFNIGNDLHIEKTVHQKLNSYRSMGEWFIAPFETIQRIIVEVLLEYYPEPVPVKKAIVVEIPKTEPKKINRFPYLAWIIFDLIVLIGIVFYFTFEFTRIEIYFGLSMVLCGFGTLGTTLLHNLEKIKGT